MASYVYGVFVVFIFLAIHVDAQCPSGWISNGSSCYHFSHDSETFAGAVMMCKVLGGYLAEISDVVETAFIESYMRKTNATVDYWIGLTDVSNEGEWVWFTTGTVATYTYFAHHQPNNNHDIENCVHVRESGQWNDVPCDDHDNYICER